MQRKLIPMLLGICLSASLTACAGHTSIRPTPNVDPFLQPTTIEGKHTSLDAVMADPNSTTRDLVDFAGSAEDAVKRANADKAAAKAVLDGKEKQ